MRSTTLVPYVLSGALACGAGRGEGGGTQSSVGTDGGGSTAGSGSAGTGTATATAGSGASTSGGTKYDVGAASGGASDTQGGCPPLPTDATLTGTVFAPNQTLPISGAAVYFTTVEPDSIPDGVYCEACVQVDCQIPLTTTAADGSFSLDVASGSGFLVVRKGQFMRVSPFDVSPGTTPVPAVFTSMPRDWAPAQGRYIPRVAVALADHDRIENALAKLGLGDTEILDYDEDLIVGTEPFDVWDNAPQQDFAGSLGTFAELLLDPTRLDDYHVLFVGCTQQAGEYPAVLDDPQAQANLQAWVAAGGKLYVSDWAGEVLNIPFGQYQDFWLRQDSTTVPQWAGQDTLDLGRYDPVATVLDPDLLAWLQALPAPYDDINPWNDPNQEVLPTLADLPEFQAMYVYSGIKDTPPVLVDDGMGGMVDVGHKTWIEAPGTETWGVPPPDEVHPLTITAEYGCGRVMFTGYHTVEGRDYVGLTPQELVLLYLILEIGVCQVPYEPPPPQG
jgi:hypothetical protein